MKILEVKWLLMAWMLQNLNDVDLKLVLKMLVLLAEGYVSQSSSKAGLDLELLYKEFDEYIDLLRCPVCL